MKINELIGLARDWAEEPQLPERILLYLINLIEGRVQKELLLKTTNIVQYDPEDVTDGTALILDDTESDVYLFYITSMLAYRRGEYEEYQNRKVMFDDAWTRLSRRLALQEHRGTSETSAYG